MIRAVLIRYRVFSLSFRFLSLALGFWGAGESITWGYWSMSEGQTANAVHFIFCLCLVCHLGCREHKIAVDLMIVPTLGCCVANARDMTKQAMSNSISSSRR